MATTFLESMLDRSVPYHWLLHFEAQGFTARYAESDLVVGGLLWRGIVEMTQLPEIGANPYTGQGSAGSWAFRLAPERSDILSATATKEHDSEAINGFSYGEATVTLYRWPEGCALSEAQVVSVGTVDAITMESDGSLRVEVVSITEKYDAPLPAHMITDDITYHTATTAAVYEDDIGRGYPILYGQFRRIECPVVDTTEEYALMAGHHVAGYTTAWKDDDDSATPTLRNTTDSAGRDVAILDFVTLGANEFVTVTATGANGGHEDTDDGTYTGTGGALILHPCDQLRHLAAVFAEVPAARIDPGSFIFGRQFLSGFEFSTLITADDNTSYFRVASEIGQWLVAVVLFERGRLRFRLVDLSAFPAAHFTDREIIDIPSISWGEKNDTISMVRLRYEWGWVRKKKQMDFRKAVTLGVDDRADLKRNYLRYGERALELETKHLYDGATAGHVAARMAELRGKLRKVVTVSVDRASHEVNIFDVVQLTTAYAPSADGGGWDAKKFIVTGVAYDLIENRLTLLEV